MKNLCFISIFALLFSCSSSTTEPNLDNQANLSNNTGEQKTAVFVEEEDGSFKQDGTTQNQPSDNDSVTVFDEETNTWKTVLYKDVKSSN